MADFSKLNGYNVKDATARNAISQLTKLETIWKGKTVVAFGTSITAYCSNYNGGFLQRLKEICGFSSYTNKGVSGASLLSGVNGVANVTTGIYDAIMNYNITEDLILIEAGCNDYKLNIPLGTINTTSTLTFAGTLKAIIEHLSTTYPTKKIVLIASKQGFNETVYTRDYVNSAGHTQQDYTEMIVEIGNRYGIPVCDWFRCGLINEFNRNSFTYDGTHPNEAGYKLLGETLAGVVSFMNSSATATKPIDKVIEINGEYFTFTTGKLFEFHLILSINDTYYAYHSHRPLFVCVDGSSYYEAFDHSLTLRSNNSEGANYNTFSDGFEQNLEGLIELSDGYYKTKSARTKASFIKANHVVKLWGTDTVLLNKTFN